MKSLASFFIPAPEYIACPMCDVLHRKIPLQPKMQARCTRCHTVLYSKDRCLVNDGVGKAYSNGRLDTWIAFGLTSLLLCIMANVCTLAQCILHGQVSHVSLWRGLGQLWAEKNGLLIIMGGCLAYAGIIVPTLQSIALLFLVLPLRFVVFKKQSAFCARYTEHMGLKLISVLEHLKPWGMLDVLLLSILVTFIKFSEVAYIAIGPALLALASLAILQSIFSTAGLSKIRNLLDSAKAFSGNMRVRSVPCIAYSELNRPIHQMANPKKGAGGYMSRAVASHLCCPKCRLLHRNKVAYLGTVGCIAQESQAQAITATLKYAEHPLPAPACHRCGAYLIINKARGLQYVWALWLSAILLYVPAMLLPMMHTRSFRASGGSTLLEGVAHFWATGSKGLALLILVASVCVPLLKLGVLGALLLSAQRGICRRPQSYMRLYQLIHALGRWSMLDIFVVTLTVVLMHFYAFATVTAGAGAIAFAGVVVLTLLASQAFNPHWIWQGNLDH